MSRILIYGYGNPGRQDDGLGILLAEKLEKWAEKAGYDFIDFDSNYQLNVEDALAISEYDLVIFADASIEKIQNFIITKVHPSKKTEFTMHAVTPDYVLHLCHSLYAKFPATYLIHLKGFEFEFLEKLTKKAEANLKAAFDLMVEILTNDGDMTNMLEHHMFGKSKIEN